MLGITRRGLLQVAGSVVLVRCADPLGANDGRPVDTKEVPLDEAIQVDGALFPISVMAGDATSSSAVVLTRFLGESALRLKIWEDVEGKRRVWFDGVVTPNADGFVHVDAQDLGADRAYRYGFFAVNGSGRSPIGNFRTAWPEDKLAPLTFGGTSCTKQRRWPWPVLAQAATEDLAFFIHNGDHIYADEGTTREEYRAIYEASYQQSGMKLVHQAFGHYVTWDDHEFDQGFNPETFPRSRYEAAAGTFFEHLPVRRNNGHLWRSFQWGQTAEIFMLDCRSERLPSTRNTPHAQYISPKQMQWLKEGLRASTAQFKFIVNSVPIGSFGGLWDVQAIDRWEGYSAQREELLELIENEISGVWFCSGDFHLGAVGRAEKSGRFSTVKELLWGPGGQIINALYPTLKKPQWDYVISECNYTKLTCDPETNTLRIRFIDENGNDLLDVSYDNS